MCYCVQTPSSPFGLVLVFCSSLVSMSTRSLGLFGFVSGLAELCGITDIYGACPWSCYLVFIVTLFVAGL